MLGLIQRVSSASVSIDHHIAGQINRVIVLLLGIEKTTTKQRLINSYKRL